MLFDLFFISLYQNALLLFITLPMVVAVQAGEKQVGILDVLIALMFIGFVVLETVADQQQWNFQNEKNRRKKAGQKLTEEQAHGFISSGLFAKVRHPNYAGEQAIWITFYLFSVAATGRLINWSLAGCLLLIVLFQSSSNFSEDISSKKYPAYLAYKKRVGRFLPKLW
jgi:steroid 5-alpha reductase family enzyme